MWSRKHHIERNTQRERFDRATRRVVRTDNAPDLPGDDSHEHEDPDREHHHDPDTGTVVQWEKEIDGHDYDDRETRAHYCNGDETSSTSESEVLNLR